MVRSPNTVDAFIGSEIVRRRKVVGLSQQALAQRIGVTFQQLQKYENATNRVAASRLAEIAKALGSKPGDFFPAINHPWMTDAERTASEAA